MKRKQSTLKESTTAGSIASVANPQRRRGKKNPSIYKDDPAGNLFRGISVRGGHQISEEELAEDDLIIVPGQKIRRKTGFVPRDQKRTDHEVSMARSDLIQAAKSAKTIFELIKDRTEDVGIEGWVQEKLIKANDYLNAVREYYEERAVSGTEDGMDDAGSYGMKSCGCPADCDCNDTPDYSSMFESAMSQGNKKGVAEGSVTEKAVSKQQQKFFGMVHALQKGEKIPGASAKLKKTAKSMSSGDVSDFAKTKHSGLPTKVKK